MKDENEQIAYNSSYSRQKPLNSPAKFGIRHRQVSEIPVSQCGFHFGVEPHWRLGPDRQVT